MATLGCSQGRLTEVGSPIGVSPGSRESERWESALRRSLTFANYRVVIRTEQLQQLRWAMSRWHERRAGRLHARRLRQRADVHLVAYTAARTLRSWVRFTVLTRRAARQRERAGGHLFAYRAGRALHSWVTFAALSRQAARR